MEQGGAGLVSGHRGKASTGLQPANVKQEVLRILRAYYADFGPTFASQKLKEKQGLSFSPCTIRIWMKEDGLWVDRRHRQPAIHQPRARRHGSGELVLNVGSQDYWFVYRGAACTLLVDNAVVAGPLSSLILFIYSGCLSSFRRL